MHTRAHTHVRTHTHTHVRTHRLERLTQNLLHSSDVFKLSTLFEFCVTHGLTMSVSGEEVNETLYGNIAFQPYNCTLCINSFSMTESVGWGRSSFDWLTHKKCGTGPTQIQDNHKNQSTERELSSDVALSQLEAVSLPAFNTYSCVGTVSTEHYAQALPMFCWPCISV